MVRKQLRMMKREVARRLHPEGFPWGGILMLHRVDNIDTDRLWYNEHLKVSPEFLDQLLRSFRKKGFSFISLDELVDIHANKRRVRKVLSITLDDGYRDNLTNGLPIFQTHRTPFCIYVTTRFPEKEMVYWWYLLEDLILQNDQIVLSNGKIVSCADKEEKEQAFLRIRQEILNLPQDDLNKHIVSLLQSYSVDYYTYNDSLPLTWEMLRQLVKEPLATIGGHTHSHISFSSCSEPFIVQDVEKSISLMRQKADACMWHFAYPYGDSVSVKPFHAKVLSSFGFKTIATTQDGLLNSNSELSQLPRLFVTERNAKMILERLSHEC